MIIRASRSIPHKQSKTIRTKMSPLIRQFLLFFLVVTNLSTISASIDSVTAPSSIQADQPTQISIDVSSWFDLVSNYRVQLAIHTAHGKDGFWQYYQGACNLLNSTAITTTNVSITIPSNIGPNGPYQIQIDVFENNTFSPLIPYTMGYGVAKANFTLTSATGETQPWENDLEWMGFPFYRYEILPCSAYKCAKQCYQNTWPKNEDTNDACPLRLSYECAAACEGISVVEWPSWEDSVATSNSGNSSFGRADHCNASSTAAGFGASTTVSATATTRTTSSTKSAANSVKDVSLVLGILNIGSALPLLVLQGYKLWSLDPLFGRA